MIFVDSNVILDIATPDSPWLDWSLSSLLDAARRDRLVVNDVVYAEVSARFPSVQLTDEALRRLLVSVEPTPRQALFAAAKAHGQYRKNRGPRSSLLPDFFIGAHAEALGCPLITRDVSRYRTYFPSVELVTP